MDIGARSKVGLMGKDKIPPITLWRTWRMCVVFGCIFTISTVLWSPWFDIGSFSKGRVSANFQQLPRLPVITSEDNTRIALPEPVRSISVQDAVVFPDNVLLLVKVSKAFDLEGNIDDLECRFGSALTSTSVISIKPRTKDIQMVRCRLPDVQDFPSNSLNVTLGLRKSDVKVRSNAVYTPNPLPQWSTLVYECLLDTDSIILLAKGLGSKALKRFDENSITCVFGNRLPSDVMFETRALSAAQEVIRCEKPPSHMEEKLRGSRVSVSSNWMGVLPSVAYYKPENGPDWFLSSNKIRSSSTVGFPIITEGLKKGEKMLLDSENPGSLLSTVDRYNHIPVGSSKKRKLCACAMVWNKAEFIREWVMFHSYMGVEKFYIYDNDSDDDIADVLDSLVSYNVTGMVWPWIKTHQAAFSHCTILAREECDWMMFSDVDEYIHPRSYLRVLKKDSPRLDAMVLHRVIDNEVENLAKSKSRSLGEIQFHCNDFGPSGLDSTPQQGVTVGYTCRLKLSQRHKSIVLLEAVNTSLLNVIHHFELRQPFTSIKMSRRDVVVNHYKYQAWDAFKMKFVRRAGTYTTDWQKAENTESKDRTPGLGTKAVKPADWESRFCEVHDYGLRNFSLSTFGVPSNPSKLKWQLLSHLPSKPRR